MERMNVILVTLFYALVDPGSLHVLHSTHGLPAVKSVQAHSAKCDAYISDGVDVSFQEKIKNNTTRHDHQENLIKTVKMDEITTESCFLRWSSKDNKILGLCYQHSHNVNLSFNT